MIQWIEETGNYKNRYFIFLLTRCMVSQQNEWFYLITNIFTKIFVFWWSRLHSIIIVDFFKGVKPSPVGPSHLSIKRTGVKWCIPRNFPRGIASVKPRSGVCTLHTWDRARIEGGTTRSYWVGESRLSNKNRGCGVIQGVVIKGSWSD